MDNFRVIAFGTRIGIEKIKKWREGVHFDFVKLRKNRRLLVMQCTGETDPAMSLVFVVDLQSEVDQRPYDHVMVFLRTKLFVDRIHSLIIPAQLLECMAHTITERMPNTVLKVPEESIRSFLEEHGVAPEFYELYIKDKPEPVELLAQILASHKFKSPEELNQFKKWASVTKHLWRKAKFEICDMEPAQALTQTKEMFEGVKFKFGDLLSKIDALVVGQEYEPESNYQSIVGDDECSIVTNPFEQEVTEIE
jgi:hypothetical protein